jgi:hypothetical protein
MYNMLGIVKATRTTIMNQPFAHPMSPGRQKHNDT